MESAFIISWIQLDIGNPAKLNLKMMAGFPISRVLAEIRAKAQIQGALKKWWPKRGATMSMFGGTNGYTKGES